MKIAKLIIPEEVLLSKNINMVPDNYDFEGNLCIEYSMPSIFESYMKSDSIEYGLFRNILSQTCVPNWDNLSFEERKICVKYFKYPLNITNEEYVSYFSSEEDELNWGRMIDQTTGEFSIQNGIRGKRLNAMVKKLTYRLSPAQVIPIAIITKALRFEYVTDNFPHLIFWISNDTYAPMEIDYTTNGFAQMNGYSNELRDSLLNIINNGNY